MTAALYDEYYFDARTSEKLKKLFKRTREVMEILRKSNSEWYDEFRSQNREITILEDYNLRRIIQDPEYQSIDTMILRKKLLESWEEKIEGLK